jgi:hypothetical protein
VWVGKNEKNLSFLQGCYMRLSDLQARLLHHPYIKDDCRNIYVEKLLPFPVWDGNGVLITELKVYESMFRKWDFNYEEFPNPPLGWWDNLQGHLELNGPTHELNQIEAGFWTLTGRTLF